MRQLLYPCLIVALVAGVAQADFTGTGPGIDSGSWVDQGDDGVGDNSSTINVTGTSGTITDVSITINDFEHTWVGDISATLSNGVDTVFVFPLADDGTTFGPSVDVEVGDYTFDSSGTLDWLTEAFDGDNLSPGNYFADFSVFNGQAKDGDWTLTINDRAGGDEGAFSGWTLNITSSNVIPEPTTFGLIACVAGLAAARRRR